MSTPTPSFRIVLLSVLLVVPLLTLLTAPALSVAQGSRAAVIAEGLPLPVVSDD